MQHYLSKSEKSTLSVLYGMVDYLAKLDEIYSKSKRKEALKLTRLARTYTKKLAGKLLEGLDNEHLMAMYKYAQKMNLVCRTKDESIRDLERLREHNEVCSLDNDRFLMLCSFAYHSCKTCTRTTYSKCVLREIFIEYDIEPLRDTKDTCGYQHTDIKENAYMNLEQNVSTGQLFRVAPGIVLKGFKRVRTSPLPSTDWNYPKITNND